VRVAVTAWIAASDQFIGKSIESMRSIRQSYERAAAIASAACTDPAVGHVHSSIIQRSISTMSERDRPIITEQDQYRLQKLFDARRGDVDEQAYHRMRATLDVADIVFSEDVPDDVITLNARFTLRHLNSGHLNSGHLKSGHLKSGNVEEYKLVLPSKSDAKKRRVSVLSPLGVSLLGARKGGRVEIEGGVQYEIVDVLYQPEAAPA
jgi:regulator of nucleoside diphosphate kinase